MKIEKRCIYCNKPTGDDPHFESECCGRGMCDDCYDSLQGTDEQMQIDHLEDEDWDRYIKGTEYEKTASYLCFDCIDYTKLTKQELIRLLINNK